ncbi:MAG: tRNA 5-methoxyuridine(34)/uridine 5-oxyacetic acid(34) synthase CmoB [Kangiellaceae bacterium]|nr:tRNA 5-methoxyuridine(34)/uridine 5-oxyacetic acid(34) synthase CmoB [Kangiellaceae bacterium]
MIHFKNLENAIKHSNIAPWYNFLIDTVNTRYKTYTHGELEQWNQLISELPEIKVAKIELSKAVKIDAQTPLNQQQLDELTIQLKKLHPWRKGPFELFGINLNTEWRSDWKWDRVFPYISSLKNKTVLDVGCGNGYHCWRMLDHAPRLVLGIDPSQKFLAQFSVMQHYLEQPHCHLLPIGIEDMPESMGKDGFDSIFCMGVLYHQKSPINLIQRLFKLLNSGGELILETLVVDGDENTVFLPSGRYAQMRNVWFLPSTTALELWLYKCGFKDVQTIDITQTTLQEQRATEWMTFHSLENFLDPNDINKTIEGHPAPKRATIIAKR